MKLETQRLAIALLAASFAAAPAIAQLAQGAVQEPSIVISHKLLPSRDLIVRTVYIGDLDLKSAGAQKEMERRVNAAVEEMCAIPTPIPGQERNMTRPCRDDAWASARPQMADKVKAATGN
jgi:UrcA family protein